jgi:hypothetical protein
MTVLLSCNFPAAISVQAFHCFKRRIQDKFSMKDSKERFKGSQHENLLAPIMNFSVFHC